MTRVPARTAGPTAGFFGPPPRLRKSHDCKGMLIESTAGGIDNVT